MEQRLDATYLRSGLFERIAGVGICAAGIGAGILLVAWGISFLWRYTLPEIAVRVAVPELHLAQDSTLRVAQDKPFVVAQSEPFKLDPANVTVGVQPSRQIDDEVVKEGRTATGDVIKREVTIFTNVSHEPGTVVTGWNFRDGSGGVPVHQFCYYTSPNLDHSSIRIDIASNRAPSPIDAGLVPDLNIALAKCHWWNGEGH
jgi:hypothetical protein